MEDKQSTGFQARSSSARKGNSFPMVLVISREPFGAKNGFGIWLKILFAQWPRDRIIQAFFDPNGSPNSELCLDFYKIDLPKKTFNLISILNLLRQYLRGNYVTVDGIFTAKITTSFNDWIEKYNPDIIYTGLGPLWLLRFLCKVVDKYRCRIVVHVLDDFVRDWPACGNSLRKLMPVTWILNIWIKYVLKKVFVRSDKRFTVSSDMACEYEKRYGLPFTVMQLGINKNDWLKSVDSKVSDGEPVRILYPGTVLRSTNLSTIAFVSSAVSELAAEGTSIQFDIACPAKCHSICGHLQNKQVVNFVDMFSHELVPTVFRKTDILLLPFNFNASTKAFIQYSWPTKLAEYFASGTPILILGPRGVGFIEYAIENNCGFYVKEATVSVVKESIKQILTCPQAVRTTTSNARRIAFNNFDNQKTRSLFQTELCSLGK